MKSLRIPLSFFPQDRLKTLPKWAFAVALRFIAVFAVVVSMGCGMGADSTEDSLVAEGVLSAEEALVEEDTPSEEGIFAINDTENEVAGNDMDDRKMAGDDGFGFFSLTTDETEEGKGQSTPSFSEEKSKPQRRIQFYDGFNSNRWHRNYGIYRRRNVAHLRSGCFGQGGCIRIRVRRGSHYGVGINYTFRDKFGYEPEHLFAEYHVMYEQSMSRYNGKAAGFWGTYGSGGWGGKRSDGYNGWSARGALYGLKDGIANWYYVYHVHQKKHYGDVLHWGPGWGFKMRYGGWYHVKQFIRLNTPWKRDGVLKAWVNGRLVYSRSNFMFRKTRKLKIQSYLINYYHGGSAVSPVDGYVRIDNLKVYN